MRNVRNCWIEVQTDGNKTIATGPRASVGGMTCRLLLREKGSISDTEIRTEVRSIDGKIYARVFVGGVCVSSTELDR